MDKPCVVLCAPRGSKVIPWKDTGCGTRAFFKRSCVHLRPLQDEVRVLTSVLTTRFSQKGEESDLCKAGLAVQGQHIKGKGTDSVDVLRQVPTASRFCTILSLALISGDMCSKIMSSLVVSARAISSPSPTLAWSCSEFSKYFQFPE